MRPPEAVVAVQHLLGEAWDLLRHTEGTSRLQGAWADHLARHLPDVIEAQDAAVAAGYHERDFGIRAGLLVGAMLAARADGSKVGTTDVAMALLDAAAWLDADATAGDWPEGQAARDEKIDRMVVPPKASELDMCQTREVLEVLTATRRAAEVAAVGDATAAATDLWRTLNGADLATATVAQMIDLDRSQQGAALEGRARLDRILDERPEWSP